MLFQQLWTIFSFLILWKYFHVTEAFALGGLVKVQSACIQSSLWTPTPSLVQNLCLQCFCVRAALSLSLCKVVNPTLFQGTCVLATATTTTTARPPIPTSPVTTVIPIITGPTLPTTTIAPPTTTALTSTTTTTTTRAPITIFPTFFPYYPNYTLPINYPGGTFPINYPGLPGTYPINFPVTSPINYPGLPSGYNPLIELLGLGGTAGTGVAIPPIKYINAAKSNNIPIVFPK